MSPIGRTKIPVNETNKTSSYCKPIVIAGRVTCIYNMFASKQCEQLKTVREVTYQKMVEWTSFEGLPPLKQIQFGMIIFDIMNLIYWELAQKKYDINIHMVKTR